MQRLLLVLLIVCAQTIAFANPKQAAVHSRQGKAYFDAKQYDEAIGEFRKAYELDKKPVSLFKIASAYYAKGDYQGAIDYYGRYLQADPDGPLAQQALEFTTIATKALADLKAKAEAEAKAAAEADAKRKAEAEAETRRVAAAAHVKQAEAYARAGTWTSAGDEYRAAAEAGDDPAFLIDAAEAYRKQPDNENARAAYQAYLEKVQLGDRSDEIRGKLADVQRAIDLDRVDKAAADGAEQERQRKLQAAIVHDDRPTPRPTFKRGWIVVGGAAILTGLVADFAAPNGDNGKLDASDLAPVVLYGLGATAVLRGVF